MSPAVGARSSPTIRPRHPEAADAGHGRRPLPSSFQMDTPTRCRWARPLNPLYVRYHDDEWGVPCTDETRLFEMLNLEGAQAGLSWETILNKREGNRAAFDGWDAAKIAAYGPEKVAELLA